MHLHYVQTRAPTVLHRTEQSIRLSEGSKHIDTLQEVS